MNDHEFATSVKGLLSGCIASLDAQKGRFLRNPGKDFSRERKIPFTELVSICLQMEGGSLQNELLKYFRFSDSAPTKSAFCQQRAKVSPEAFEALFRSFTSSVSRDGCLRTFHGYRLIACDGSDISIPYNPADAETFFQPRDRKGFNLLHLNALYDILNGIYPDCVLAPQNKAHERAAFNTMVGRYTSRTPAIFIADRGYEGWNVFAHLIRSGERFVIRLKDVGSNGILSSFDLPGDGEFDEDISTVLTRRQTNEVKEDRDTYTVIPYSSDFDFLDEARPFFPISFRAVRFEAAPGVFVCVATNLPRGVFTTDMVKELYHKRWDQEGSFRDLKYTLDLLHFHCRKRESVEQEVWARLTVYNFCEAITRHAAESLRDAGGRKQRKHDYKVNFATAACICKAFLKAGGIDDPARLIRRFLIPVRPGRKAPRKVRTQSARMFLYRAA